jgi:hypothetical protein
MCTIKAKRHDNDNDNGITNLSFMKKKASFLLPRHSIRADQTSSSSTKAASIACFALSNRTKVRSRTHQLLVLTLASLAVHASYP